MQISAIKSEKNISELNIFYGFISDLVFEVQHLSIYIHANGQNKIET